MIGWVVYEWFLWWVCGLWGIQLVCGVYEWFGWYMSGLGGIRVVWYVGCEYLGS